MMARIGCLSLNHHPGLRFLFGQSFEITRQCRTGKLMLIVNGPAAGFELSKKYLYLEFKEGTLDHEVEIRGSGLDLGVVNPLCLFFIDQRVLISMITKFIKFIELNFPVITRGFSVNQLVWSTPNGCFVSSTKSHKSITSLSDKSKVISSPFDLDATIVSIAASEWFLHVVFDSLLPPTQVLIASHSLFCNPVFMKLFNGSHRILWANNRVLFAFNSFFLASFCLAVLGGIGPFTLAMQEQWHHHSSITSQRALSVLYE
ncbi:hypothetical protein Tco_0046051 [Tanacetum coccineum]